MDNVSMVLGLLSGSKELVGEADADWVAAEAKRDAWKAGAMMKLPPHLQLPPGRQFPTGVDWSAFSGSAQARAERTQARQQWRRANATLNAADEALERDGLSEAETKAAAAEVLQAQTVEREAKRLLDEQVAAVEAGHVERLLAVLPTKELRERFEGHMEAIRRVDACCNSPSCPWGRGVRLPAAAFAEVLLHEWSGDEDSVERRELFEALVTEMRKEPHATWTGRLAGTASSGSPAPAPPPAPAQQGRRGWRLFGCCRPPPAE